MGKELERFGSEEETLTFDIGKYQDAVVWNTDWTVETLINQTKKGNIDLNPNFQRRDAWGFDAKSKLIESLIIGIPVPPIILAEKKEKKNSYIVLDGKQRLLTINQFFSDISESDDTLENNDFINFKLKSLDFLKGLNGLNLKEISNSDDPSFSDYTNSLENQSIRTIIIKNWPDEEYLYSVFLRLNTGSKPLSAQELRQALIPGPFLNYLDEKTSKSDSIKKLLSNNKPDSRMRDVELALRFYAFYENIDNYDGKLKKFLDDTAININKNWKDKENDIDSIFFLYERSLELGFTIFGEKAAFSRYIDDHYANISNRPIIDMLTYFFSIDSIYHMISENKDLFKKRFEDLNADEDFKTSVSFTTNNVSSVRIRFNKFIGLLNDMQPGIINYQFDIFEGKLIRRSL